MRVEFCNIWEKHDKGDWIAITTNGIIKANGENVMGKGVAQQARLKFPTLPEEIGTLIKKYGNLPFIFQERRITTLPVKHDWREPAKLELIGFSLGAILFHFSTVLSTLYIPLPGCGNGQLSWTKEVKPFLNSIVKKWPNNIIFCCKSEKELN